mmetsp:Transcript_3326/g.11141  ORF Transcript_3326/g.11141 Transcript_3326/m.11141 type:complete len:293 (+) Transcript_3326:357-1235(+)
MLGGFDPRTISTIPFAYVPFPATCELEHCNFVHHNETCALMEWGCTLPSGWLRSLRLVRISPPASWRLEFAVTAAVRAFPTSSNECSPPPAVAAAAAVCATLRQIAVAVVGGTATAVSRHRRCQAIPRYLPVALARQADAGLLTALARPRLHQQLLSLLLKAPQALGLLAPRLLARQIGGDALALGAGLFVAEPELLVRGPVLALHFKFPQLLPLHSLLGLHSGGRVHLELLQPLFLRPPLLVHAVAALQRDPERMLGQELLAVRNEGAQGTILLWLHGVLLHALGQGVPPR